ncbi:hypothetical protein GALL_439780 [mine drainage metagenome]|uniref:Uncharacterized protein n=1 Tax=mine drainage metagenome TaxID=410659 RepID=A0A1J5PTB1_9ZZZZ
MFRPGRCRLARGGFRRWRRCARPVGQIELVHAGNELEHSLLPATRGLHAAASELALQLKIRRLAHGTAIAGVALQREGEGFGQARIGQLSGQLERRQAVARLCQIDLQRRRQGELKARGFAAGAPLHIDLQHRNAQRIPGTARPLGGHLHLQRLCACKSEIGIDRPELHRLVLEADCWQLRLQGEQSALRGAGVGLDRPRCRRQPRRRGRHQIDRARELRLDGLQPERISLHRQGEVAQGIAVLRGIGQQLAAHFDLRGQCRLGEARRRGQMQRAAAATGQSGQFQIQPGELPAGLAFVVVVDNSALFDLQPVHRQSQRTARLVRRSALRLVLGHQVGKVEPALRVPDEMDLRLDHHHPVHHQFPPQQGEQVEVQPQVVGADKEFRLVALAQGERPGAQGQRRKQLEFDRSRKGEGAVFALLHHLDQRRLVLIGIEGQHHDAQPAHHENEGSDQRGGHPPDHPKRQGLAGNGRYGCAWSDLGHRPGLPAPACGQGAQCGSLSAVIGRILGRLPDNAFRDTSRAFFHHANPFRRDPDLRRRRRRQGLRPGAGAGRPGGHPARRTPGCRATRNRLRPARLRAQCRLKAIARRAARLAADSRCAHPAGRCHVHPGRWRRTRVQRVWVAG